MGVLHVLKLRPYFREYKKRTYLDSVSASIATSVPAYVPYNQRSGIKLTQ
jgi:hypothetical protein